MCVEQRPAERGNTQSSTQQDTTIPSAHLQWLALGIFGVRVSGGRSCAVRVSPGQLVDESQKFLAALQPHSPLHVLAVLPHGISCTPTNVAPPPCADLVLAMQPQALTLTHPWSSLVNTP
jgi:hypothetical protein